MRIFSFWIEIGNWILFEERRGNQGRERMTRKYTKLENRAREKCEYKWIHIEKIYKFLIRRMVLSKIMKNIGCLSKSVVF